MKGTFSKLLGIIMIIAGMSVKLHGQSSEELINHYNDGVKLANTNPKGAVDHFLRVIILCNQINDTAVIKVCGQAKNQLPALQYKYAANLYMAGNIDSALVNFDKAYQFAVTYGDSITKGKAIENLTKIYMAIANAYYKDNDSANTMIYINKALSYDPNCAKAYLTKGLIYKKQDNPQLMREALDKAIAFGNESDDVRTVNAAKKYMKDFYFGNAKDAIDKKSFRQAVEYLDSTLIYDDRDHNIYYLYAQAYNGLSEWDKAIAAASKGMELAGMTDEAKAKFYFEIGNACIGKNDKEAACSAFRNAQYGGYIEQAKYQIETVLKCK